MFDYDWKLQNLGENIRLKIFYKRRSRSRKKLQILFFSRFQGGGAAAPCPLP